MISVMGSQTPKAIAANSIPIKAIITPLWATSKREKVEQLTGVPAPDAASHPDDWETEMEGSEIDIEFSSTISSMELRELFVSMGYIGATVLHESYMYHPDGFESAMAQVREFIQPFDAQDYLSQITGFDVGDYVVLTLRSVTTHEPILEVYISVTLQEDDLPPF